MAYVVPEDRQYQRILMSQDSDRKLQAMGYDTFFSSNVSAGAQRGNDLFIRFHNGSVYKYPNQGKRFIELQAAASKGKWVWRFLRRPNKPYEKVGTIPLPEDTIETDEEIVRPRLPVAEVKAIVPKDFMKTGELPTIQISSIQLVRGIDNNLLSLIAGITPTLF
jgi:hypothetical protein